ncbi:MAG: glycerol-3-phosphate 1-O-acyltransferase PlsY [Coriobacteriales bacterium]|jgi:glycerol-3-phosphate acyltransferase PlsY|nr:glycerol-3-phosphate 1-O-acyltransferase PlsY [Coriobacteriales bacterium]
MIMYLISVVFALVLAFFCGSIPFALIIGKSMRGLDVREHGSGNAGSTNAIRVLGKGPGLLVFAGDVLKGALGCVIVAVTVGLSVTLASAEATQQAFSALSSTGAEAFEPDPLIGILASGNATFLYDVPMALSIIATVLGHMFSPFMSFKGGKGVATALGSVGVVLPLAALCSFGVFIVVALLTRYVSLGSILAVIAVPCFTILFYPSATYIVFTILLAVAVVAAHKKNIVRLSKGQEPKFSFGTKDKDKGREQDEKREKGRDAL